MKAKLNGEVVDALNAERGVEGENGGPGAFPAALTAEMLKDFVQTENGSTRPHHGWIDGVHYIAKCARYSEAWTATSDEHVHNEYLADRFLRAAGLRVPESREYRVDFHDGKGLRVVRLARFLENAKPLKEVVLRMGSHVEGWLKDQVVESYPIQSFIGGTDTFQNDNVLVDHEGRLWFVDNGASFDFRAQGARKHPSWFDRKDPEDPHYGYLSLLKHHSQRLLQALLPESLAAGIIRRFDFVSLAHNLPEELKKPSVEAYAQALNAWRR